MTRPRKRFGQHFLRDQNVIRRIVAAMDPRPGEHFIEIGPGEGVLTAPLLAAGVRLDAVEIDRDLAAALPGRCPGPLTVHRADALDFDFAALAAGPGTLRLAGNLPYNISTPLLFHLLATRAAFRDLHVMLQKEVGDRMAAGAGDPAYGRLSVALAARCRVERLFGVRPGSFWPPPKVDSLVLRLVPHAGNPLGISDFATFDAVVTRAFGQRRKQLGTSLRPLRPEAALRAAGIDPALRPERLPPAGFAALANALAAAGPLARS
jgi:16S rRNA (adenine1518-N6/adenine1519-N6)-dimethyltransferase